MSNDSTVPLAAPAATSTAITFYHCQLTGLPSQVTGKKPGTYGLPHTRRGSGPRHKTSGKAGKPAMTDYTGAYSPQDQAQPSTTAVARNEAANVGQSAAGAGRSSHVAQTARHPTRPGWSPPRLRARRGTCSARRAGKRLTRRPSSSRGPRASYGPLLTNFRRWRPRAASPAWPPRSRIRRPNAFTARLPGSSSASPPTCCRRSGTSPVGARECSWLALRPWAWWLDA